MTVHGLGTKGEQGGARDLWVTKFIFLYSLDGTNFIEYLDDVGNSGNVSVAVKCGSMVQC